MQHSICVSFYVKLPFFCKINLIFLCCTSFAQADNLVHLRARTRRKTKIRILVSFSTIFLYTGWGSQSRSLVIPSFDEKRKEWERVRGSFVSYPPKPSAPRFCTTIHTNERLRLWWVYRVSMGGCTYTSVKKYQSFELDQ